MPNDILLTVHVKQVAINHLKWAEGMQVSLPKSVMEKTRLIEHIDAKGNLIIPDDKFHFKEDVDNLRLRAAFTDQKPTSSRLPISYQKIPPGIRALIAKILGRWKRHKINQWAVFPKWPLDLSADFLSDLLGEQPSPFMKGPTPVLLTHDIDSQEGLCNLEKLFLEMEESVGARSCNYIVPSAWPIDYALLDEIKRRGHEIGIHGYDHSNKTAFLDSAERRRRLSSAQNLIERYDIKGYRSPSLLRTRDMLRDLSHYYQYDSSIPTSGGLFPIPNNGCASARPFGIEGIAEIPLSMPRDGSLLFLGYSPEQILDLWIDCAEKISRSYGVVVLLTHCENHFSGGSPMLGIYRQFLDYISASKRFVWSNSKEMLF